MLAVGYVALYLALDRLSFIGALHGVGITPWNPSTGLAMALLVIKGLRYAPLVMVAELLSGATLPVAPVSPVPIFLPSLVVTARPAAAAGIATKLGNHSFRATGITAYLKNGGTLEKAVAMANHASTRTTQLYDRRRHEVSLDEVERIVICPAGSV